MGFEGSGLKMAVTSLLTASAVDAQVNNNTETMPCTATGNCFIYTPPSYRLGLAKPRLLNFRIPDHRDIAAIARGAAVQHLFDAATADLEVQHSRPAVDI